MSPTWQKASIRLRSRLAKPILSPGIPMRQGLESADRWKRIRDYHSGSPLPWYATSPRASQSPRGEGMNARTNLSFLFPAKRPTLLNAFNGLRQVPSVIQLLSVFQCPTFAFLILVYLSSICGPIILRAPLLAAVHLVLTSSISPPLNHFPLQLPTTHRPHAHNPTSSKARPGQSS